MPDVAVQEPVVSARPADITPELEEALQRLRLCNAIREVADLPRPVRVAELSRFPRAAVQWVDQRLQHRPASTTPRSVWQLIGWLVSDAVMLVCLRLWFFRWAIWRNGRGTLGSMVRHAVFHRTRSYALPASEVTGYLRVSEAEEALIRISLLWRTMKRYGACVDLLIQRLRSGLPAGQSCEWLAFFLREAGDVQTAERLLNGAPPAGWREGPSAIGVPTPHRAEPARPTALKYGLIMPAMFDSDVFRGSLRSVVGSDFKGQVVVAEDGHTPQRLCEAFCRELGVSYVKNPRWGGPASAMELGMRALDPDIEIAIFSHSDVLYPPQWFAQLDEAWRGVYDTGKVGILNLGNLQFRARVDPALKELFARGRYHDLLWVLRTRRDIPPHLEDLLDLQNTDLGRRFGLGRDNWGDCPAKLQFMTGKFSAGASFLVSMWKELGGFSLEMPFGFDMELHVQGCRTRRWNLWMNNTPLIHLVSSDTGRLPRGHDEHFGRMTHETYSRFPEKYGWDVDHFFWTYFAEIRVAYHDAIVDAVNEGRFADIDWIFDELADRMARKTRATCEFRWCRRWTTCPYDGR